MRFQFSLRLAFVITTAVALVVGLHVSTVTGLSRVSETVEIELRRAHPTYSGSGIFVEAEYVVPGVVCVDVSYGGWRGYSRHYVDFFGVLIPLPMKSSWIS